MKFKGIRISPHPPPRSLRQNPGRLVTGGPVFTVPGQRHACSARTRGWTHGTEENREWLGVRTQLLSTTSRDAFLIYFTKGQYREGADCPELAAAPCCHRRRRQQPGTATSATSGVLPGQLLGTGKWQGWGSLYLTTSHQKNSLILKTRQIPNQLWVTINI